MASKIGPRTNRDRKSAVSVWKSLTAVETIVASNAANTGIRQLKGLAPVVFSTILLFLLNAKTIVFWSRSCVSNPGCLLDVPLPYETTGFGLLFTIPRSTIA
jgi:hypothetical protein